MTLIAVGCSSRVQPVPPLSRAQNLDRALANATRFLVDRQSDDGAWRSDVYGTFRHGDALTPLVLDALQSLPPDPKRTSSIRKGLHYLAALEPRPELNYPTYTAALAVVVLGRSDLAEHRRARDAWLSFLRARQLTEEKGWRPDDAAYGGWGFGEAPPRGPGAVPAFAQANISTTVFAVEALRSAGVPPDDAALRQALVFLRRCQNHGGTEFDDGGFFFSPEDVVRNKAGGAAQDGAARYHSYGSATADGLRGLFACGVSDDDPRVTKSRRWLERNFDAASHPGRYTADREKLRESVYYYWCRSAALAVPNDRPRLDAIADALLERQRPDGSWVNPLVAQREDDPMVSTSFALAALARCR